MKIIPFIVASKIRKSLGISLTKEQKDLQTENNKTMTKKKDTNKLEGHLMFMHWKNYTVKMSTLFKVICGFHTVPIKISMALLLKQKKQS